MAAAPDGEPEGRFRDVERGLPVARGQLQAHQLRRQLPGVGGTGGAFLNGRPIHVSKTPFRDALVSFGTAPYYEELEDTGLKLAGDFLHHCADIRRSGSAALDLAYLACGRHDVFFELRLKPWDYAAGSLLVQEAGGEVQMPLDGGGMDYDRSAAVLAANPLCMPEALEVFRRNGLVK